MGDRLSGIMGEMWMGKKISVKRNSTIVHDDVKGLHCSFWGARGEAQVVALCEKFFEAWEQCGGSSLGTSTV